MTEICFVRHGQTAWNLEKRIQGTAQTVLNELGKQQALQCAQLLKNESWDVILSSPLPRAHETAEIIGNELGIKQVTPLQAWSERDYGEATGWGYNEMIEAYRKGKISGFENDDRLSERTAAGLNEIHNQYCKKRVLVISHGVTILSALNHGFDEPLVPEQIHLGNGCLNRMKYDDRKWTVVSFNDMNHLCS